MMQSDLHWTPIYDDDLKTEIRKSSRDLSTDYLINEEINDI